jgi:orotidine-5'-phosphate decarboxylase
VWGAAKISYSSRPSSTGPLGQQYKTPEEAVARGSDVIIVGREIYGEADPLEAAKLYKKEGWIAYEKRIGSS